MSPPKPNPPNSPNPNKSTKPTPGSFQPCARAPAGVPLLVTLTCCRCHLEQNHDLHGSRGISFGSAVPSPPNRHLAPHRQKKICKCCSFINALGTRWLINIS